MTPDDVINKFCDYLKDHGLEKNPNYVYFTNRYYTRLENHLKPDFCQEHGLHITAIEIRYLLIQGTLKYLGKEYRSL